MIITLVGGGLVAVLASRKAPDGYEDQEGFHSCRSAELYAKSRSRLQQTMWTWEGEVPAGASSLDTEPRERD
jgi:hypothetical protein